MYVIIERNTGYCLSAIHSEQESLVEHRKLTEQGRSVVMCYCDNMELLEQAMETFKSQSTYTRIKTKRKREVSNGLHGT